MRFIETHRPCPLPRLFAALSKAGKLPGDVALPLLTNNLPAAGQADLTAVGDEVITSLLLRTRAIIGTPKWA